MSRNPIVESTNPEVRQAASQFRRHPEMMCGIPKEVDLKHEPEVLEWLHKIKPEYYARTAKVVDPIIEAAYEAGNKSPSTVVGEERPEDWFKVEQLWRGFLLEYVNKEFAASTDESNLQQVQHIHDFVSHYKNLNFTYKELIYRGVRTATEVTSYLVQDMYKQQYGMRHEDNLARLQKSPGPVIDCTQLGAADIGSFVTKVGIFRDKGGSVYTVHNERLVFSESFRYYLARPAEKVPKKEQPIVGCPILLNQGQVQKIWAWGVSLYDGYL